MSDETPPQRRSTERGFTHPSPRRGLRATLASISGYGTPFAREERLFQHAACPTDYTRRARWRYAHHAALPATSDVVFDALADAEVEAAWLPSFHSVQWLTPPPHGVGSVRVLRLTYLSLVQRVTRWERGRELAFECTASTLPLTTRLYQRCAIAEREPGRATLDVELCYEPSAWLRPIHPLLRRLFARDLREAVARLPSAIERRAGGVRA